MINHTLAHLDMRSDVQKGKYPFKKITKNIKKLCMVSIGGGGGAEPGQSRARAGPAQSRARAGPEQGQSRARAGPEQGQGWASRFNNLIKVT